MTHFNAVSFIILIVLFAVVTFVGFAAARWRRAEDLMHEWGLGGRGLGSFITWPGRVPPGPAPALTPGRGACSASY